MGPSPMSTDAKKRLKEAYAQDTPPAPEYVDALLELVENPGGKPRSRHTMTLGEANLNDGAHEDLGGYQGD